MGAILRFLGAWLGIDYIAGEDGLIDRNLDSPTARIGGGIILIVLAIVLFRTLKDFKIF